VFIVLLVVVNIILRTTLSKPIEGTYDLVVVLSTVVISLSVAYCAVRDGHVAVGLFVERLSERTQNIIDFITNSIVIVALLISTWFLVQHGNMMLLKQEATTTIKIPFAPFIYLIAVGMAMLILVILGKVLKIFDKEGDQ
jgi:TRAP-type C4-dicarboxylate transport system permease small subunit